MKVGALVVAAGRGSRFGGDIPKQYRPLHGRPILRHSLSLLAAHPSLSFVRAIIHPEDQALYDKAAEGLGLLPPVHGGPERQDSVCLGLESLVNANIDAVLIHDGARPFLTRAMVDRTLAALEFHPGAIPALALSDTLKKAENNLVVSTIPRTQLWSAQTPQAFRFHDILTAHRAAKGCAMTDDASALEAMGKSVTIVPGESANIKITTTEDLLDAQRRPLFREVRTGSGFDVHAFAEGSFVTLCGIKIPHTKTLSGHSDADVALHAVTDALYGSVGAADIGHYFPPSDTRWKGAESRIFLQHAHSLVSGLGGRIANIDVTLLCEAPQIGPYRSSMIQSLSQLLRIEADRIAIKATTTERLGFTGRQEGIAAHAIATITLPSLQGKYDHTNE